jgi:hypothetical protein
MPSVCVQWKSNMPTLHIPCPKFLSNFSSKTKFIFFWLGHMVYLTGICRTAKIILGILVHFRDMSKRQIFASLHVQIFICLKFVAAYLDDGIVLQDETLQNKRSPY